ncbi:MAG: hypothetical protein IK144_11040 [Bacteroidaceae bacterium]|nr:hypothetical protein [Bacteroidaceae bacterium]
MGIKRNEAAKPQWNKWDYAEESKHDIFSRECWNKTVEWDVLLEHAKKAKGICHLLFENTYPSSLFFASIDLLEANLYVFGDLFYWLTGLNANTADFEMYLEAISHIRFWNMKCYKNLRQTCDELRKIESLFIECLKQEPLWDDLKDSPVWESDNRLSLARKRMDKPNLQTEEKLFARHRAFAYVREIYKVPKADEADLIQKIAKILQLTEFFKFLLGACGDCYYYNFASLLSSFRKSEKARSRYIKPWERYYNGTRDSLIEKMRNNPDLAPWVDRYICLEEDCNLIGRLFCEESADGVFFPLKKGMEEHYYNPDTWLNILTIAAVLMEYDEQHTQPAEKPARKPKAPSPFAEFIIDTPKREAVLKRLHEIIDGKTPKTCALTILAAVQNGILMQPTYKALSTEFPEIGDRHNYSYYLGRKNNYQDDINSIAKSF